MFVWRSSERLVWTTRAAAIAGEYMRPLAGSSKARDWRRADLTQLQLSTLETKRQQPATKQYVPIYSRQRRGKAKGLSIQHRIYLHMGAKPGGTAGFAPAS